MAILKRQRTSRPRTAATSPRVAAATKKLSTSPVLAASRKLAGSTPTSGKKAAQKKMKRAVKQTSAPSSPRQHNAEPVQIDVQQQQQQQPESQQPKQEHLDVPMSPAPASIPSPAPSAASASSAAPASDSVPEYTAEEQRMMATISSVRERLSIIEASLPTLRGQLSFHTARLCILRMGKHRSPTLNSAKAHLSHKQLRYQVGLIDEQCMQAIFRLDSLQTDSATIRKERKATVARGNAIIADSVKLLQRVDKVARFLPKEEPEQTEAAPAAAAACTEDVSIVDAEEEKEVEQPIPTRTVPSPSRAAAPIRATPPPLPPRTAAPSPAVAPTAAPTAAPALSALQRKYASLRLPTYSGPQFVSRVHPLTGSLLIEADLSGVLSEDVQVTTDPATRTLTIRGVKLPSRRRSLPEQHPFGGFFGFQPARAYPQEPFGHFTKVVSFDTIDPSASLHLDGMSAVLNADERLEITIPRKHTPAPQRRAAPQPHYAQHPAQHYAAQRGAPVQHSSGIDDEDDEEDAYSHPYAAHPFAHYGRAAPRAVPQYRPAHSFGWW